MTKTIAAGTREDSTTVFTASYPGVCDDCGERFAAGERVRYLVGVLGDRLCHADCDAAPPARRENPVCLKCFIITPCECDA